MSVDNGMYFENGKKMKVEVVSDVARTKYLMDTKKSIFANPIC